MNKDFDKLKDKVVSFADTRNEINFSLPPKTEQIKPSVRIKGKTNPNPILTKEILAKLAQEIDQTPVDSGKSLFDLAKSM